MRKSIFWLIPVLLILMACMCSVPSILPTQPAIASSTPTSDRGTANTGYVTVRLSPNQGDLTTQLRAEAQKAVAQGQKPFVEWDASWWPSCRVVSAGLADNDPQMAAAFSGVYLIRLDTDEWGWGTAEAGFEFVGIPVFFRLGADGKPTGDKIDGGAWGPDTYQNIADTMGPWFKNP